MTLRCARRFFCWLTGVWLFVGIAAEAASSQTAKQQAQMVVSGEEQLSMESVGDNGDSGEEGIYGEDDNFLLFRNRLYFKTQGQQFDTALRLDAVFFHRPPKRVTREAFRPGGSGYTTLNFDNRIDLSHLHGAIHLSNLKLTMGDFYVNFGRGMALSLIKLDDLGEDNQLRGFRVDYHLPRKLKLTLAAGVVNAAYSDPLTRQIFLDDPLDRVVGGRAEWQLFDALSFGAHGVVMKPRYTDENQISTERLYVDRSPGIGVVNGGANIEAHLEGIHLYLEGNGQLHENFRFNAEPKSENGAAVFGELGYDFSPFGLKAEGIYYRKWLMEGPYRGVGDDVVGRAPMVYNHMVTLEPNWLPIRSLGNAYGGRLGGDIYIDSLNMDLSLKNTVIHYNGGLLPNGEWRDHPKTLGVHPILSVSKTFRRPAVVLHLKAGGRYETALEKSLSKDWGRLFHVELDITVPLSGHHALVLTGQCRRHELYVTEGHAYTVTLASLGYRLSGRFDVTLAHEYSNEVDGGQHHLGNLTWMAPHHFAWAMGTLKMDGIHDGMTLRGFIGSQRGGIKCAGGVCRAYPDTVGAKLDMVLTF